MVKKGFIDRIMSSFVLRMFWNNLEDGSFIALGKDEVDQGGRVGGSQMTQKQENIEFADNIQSTVRTCVLSPAMTHSPPSLPFCVACSTSCASTVSCCC